MKRIVVLGSTGLLGRKTVELIHEKYSQNLKLLGITGFKNTELLQEQARKYGPKYVYTATEDSREALIRLSTLPEVDIVVNTLAGTAGLDPTIAALESGKILIIANKESIVAQGEKIKKISRSDQIIPMDSEHNAIFEILKQYPEQEVSEIILPCSGGPFLGLTEAQLQNITVKEALSHPVWKMGSKISIESATLINKGLEILEAHFLFNLPLDKIKVKIHPECQIHGIVSFKTEKSYGYFSVPDMVHHVENTLRHCQNLPSIGFSVKQVDLNSLNLQDPDHQTFPAINIILDYFQENPRSMSKFLKKEELIIQKFLNNNLSFLEIFKELKRA